MVAKRRNQPKRVRSSSLEAKGPEDLWTGYRLENDPRFLQRIEKARRSLRAGRGVRLEDL
jgi:hypothetical protein